MSKFCTKCGASIEDNSSFCTSCGAKFDAAPAASTASADSNDSILDKFKANANVETIKGLQSNPNFKKYVGIGVVAIAVIIIICILVSVLSGGYMKPIENYFEGIEKKDAETFMEAYHEYQLKYEKKNYCDGSADELEDGYKSAVKTFYNSLKEEYGSDLKISVSVEDKEKIDKDDLKDYEEFLQENWDKKSLEVTKGYEVEVEVTIKGDDDKDSDTSDFVVLKIDGDWCICEFSLDYVQDALDDVQDALDDTTDLLDAMGY